MTRETIDFGIDLGTTNSAIGRLRGGAVTVVKNNENAEFTPSAVWMTKTGDLYVGRKARERADLDGLNVATEFKQQMGLDGAEKVFAATDRRMTPPELSAQVLMSLARDVQRREDVTLDAAVITVPAAFELHQCEATRVAAELAGLTVCPLLQEPTAAAFAYSYGRTVDQAYWLVFDLGGGTFDASVVSVREGEFTVVKHVGDNQLGGKRIDWEIVQKLLVPAVLSERSLPDFGRGNPRWAANIAKLKLAAEQAKIELSDLDATAVSLERLDDGAGGDFDVELTLRRDDVETLSVPFYERAVQCCRSALTESGLTPAMIDRVILVGGATLAPKLRSMLADPGTGLGIEIDHSLDPVTVVAKGAAIFAGTQRMPRSAAPPPPGRYVLETEHELIGVDVEPLVGGRIRAGAGQVWDGWGIELVNDAATPPFRSGRITLSSTGTFAARLFVEPGRQTVFRVELFDAQGRRQVLEPDQLSYTHDVGPVPGEAVLAHAIGVGLASRETQRVLKQGATLPAEGRTILETLVDVDRDAGQGLIRIPILEGDHDRADRNRRVGVMDIKPGDIRRNVPAGSEVEITVLMDAARKLTAIAYVPILDEEFPMDVDLRSFVPDAAKMREDAEELTRRLRELQAAPTARERTEPDQPGPTAATEATIRRIDALLPAASGDPDAAAECEEAIRTAHIELDRVERAGEVPALRQQLEQMLEMARERIGTDGTEAERRDLREIEREIEDALRDEDVNAMRRLSETTRDLVVRMLSRTGELQVLQFNSLVDRCDEVGRTAEMDRLISDGEQALSRGEQNTLQRVNSRLARLLPAGAVPTDFSTLGTRRSRR